MRILISVAMAWLVTSIAGVAANGVSRDFSTLKSKLEGSWTFVEDGKKYDTTFEAVSQGAALLERNSGFTVMYYPNGTALMMTLFTKDGPQIRLQAPGLDAKTNSVNFTFKDATNLPTGAGHINGLRLTFKDTNHVLETWSMLSASGSQSTFAFELTRQ